LVLSPRTSTTCDGGAPELDFGSPRNSSALYASADVKGFHYDANTIFNEVLEGSVHRLQFGQTLSISHPIAKGFGNEHVHALGRVRRPHLFAATPALVAPAHVQRHPLRHAANVNLRDRLSLLASWGLKNLRSREGAVLRPLPLHRPARAAPLANRRLPQNVQLKNPARMICGDGLRRRCMLRKPI
jgi:hypothetical protein